MVQQSDRKLRLNLEQEDSHGDYEKVRLVFEKRIDLYKRFLKEESLTELDRFRLENKKESSSRVHKSVGL